MSNRPPDDGDVPSVERATGEEPPSEQRTSGEDPSSREQVDERPTDQEPPVEQPPVEQPPVEQQPDQEPTDVAVVWGVGDASTSLGSFDRALSDANLHNYNLVTLSSILPQGVAVLEQDSLEAGRWPVGEVVAVVMARNTCSEPGERIAAGIGWATAEEGGVVMEHACGTAEACERELERYLQDARRTRGWDWNNRGRTRVVETTVGEVASVVACAVYRPLQLK